MVAKRTVREIRRMSELTAMIFETAKRLGPGSGRHTPLMSAVSRLAEFKMLPSWRRMYLQGYAEGASAMLELSAAGAFAAPVVEHEIEKVEKHERLPPRMHRPKARAVLTPDGVGTGAEPEIDAKAVAWLLKALQKVAAGEITPPTNGKSQPPRT